MCAQSKFKFPSSRMIFKMFNQTTINFSNSQQQEEDPGVSNEDQDELR